jgi:hypothetical protein
LNWLESSLNKVLDDCDIIGTNIYNYDQAMLPIIWKSFN